LSIFIFTCYRHLSKHLIEPLSDIIDIMVLRYGETPWVALTGPARNELYVTGLIKCVPRSGGVVRAPRATGGAAGAVEGGSAVALRLGRSPFSAA
jgi:hypothetical protein